MGYNNHKHYRFLLESYNIGLTSQKYYDVLVRLMQLEMEGEPVEVRCNDQRPSAGTSVKWSISMVSSLD